MRTHAALQSVMDGADLQVDGFHRAERPLDLGERLVTAHRIGRRHLFLRYAGADDVDAIERRFRGDLLLEAL